MDFLRYDMHCHTSEGSVDSHCPIIEYALKLKGMGFGGMLVTDHDTYGGYEAYEKVKEDNELPDELSDFNVFKGIEYDTWDFGHFIVIMPDEYNTDELIYRGLKLGKLIELVHEGGGILGPAHPICEPFLSFYATGIRYRHYNKMLSLLPKLDFIEGYNASEADEDNYKARVLARRYNKPVTGGSDAHKDDCIGLGYAFLPDNIKTNNDLIDYIKSAPAIRLGGRRYGKTLKDKLGAWNRFLVIGFYPYNKYKAVISRVKHGLWGRG